MAEVAGIEPQSISKIESGKNFPLLSNLEKIANNLGIELEDFFLYEHKLPEDIMRDKLLEIYDNMELSDKERLFRIAKDLMI